MGNYINGDAGLWLLWAIAFSHKCFRPSPPKFSLTTIHIFSPTSLFNAILSTGWQSKDFGTHREYLCLGAGFSLDAFSHLKSLKGAAGTTALHCLCASCAQDVFGGGLLVGYWQWGTAYLRAYAWQRGAGRETAWSQWREHVALMLRLCWRYLRPARIEGPPLGPCWARLGQVGPTLGPCWAYVGLCWLYVGPMLAYVSPILAHVGPVLPLCWPYVGLCWPHVGPSWGLCWGYVGYMWDHLCWKASKMPIFPFRTPPRTQEPHKNNVFFLKTFINKKWGGRGDPGIHMNIIYIYILYSYKCRCNQI